MALRQIGRLRDQLIPERSRNRGLVNRSAAKIGRYSDQLTPEAKPEIGRHSDQLIPGTIRAVHPLASVAKNLFACQPLPSTFRIHHFAFFIKKPHGPRPAESCGHLIPLVVLFFRYEKAHTYPSHQRRTCPDACPDASAYARLIRLPNSLTFSKNP